MTKVDHFTAGGLNNAAHDVNGGIVAIEECRSSYDADFMLWDVCLNGFHKGY
jgi:hypothetical protein